MCVHSRRPKAVGLGVIRVHSLTGQVGLDMACTQSLMVCIGAVGTQTLIVCIDIAGVHSCRACTGIAGPGRVGAPSVTGCIGIVGTQSVTGMTSSGAVCVKSYIADMIGLGAVSAR